MFVIVGWILKPPAALTEAAQTAALNKGKELTGQEGMYAMRILGITLLAIVWWVGNVFTDWLTTLAMLLLWVLFGSVPFATAFGAYSSTSTWLIVGAFCLAAAIGKTGFFTRISWLLLQIFPPTFTGQVIAFLVVGAICSPLIPSATAKAVLGVTISMGVATAMGYEPESTGRYGLYTAAWFGFGASAPAFVSGSVFGYTLQGVLPDDLKPTWTSWFVAMIPWLIILLIGAFLLIRLLYNPGDSKVLSKEYVKEQYAALGKLQGKELISAVILFGAVLMWILEAQIGVNSAVTSMIAAFLCFATGILDLKKDITTAPGWGTFIFLGGVLSLATVFGSVGVDIWLQSLLSPIFSRLTNPFAAIAVIMALTIAIRLVLVSQTTTIILMVTLLSPIAASLGLAPFIIGLIVYATETSWFVPYQNSVYVAAIASTKETVSFGKTVKSCVGYEVICLVAFCVSVLYWKLLGYI